MYSHLLTISLQFDMTGGLLVGAMPIERLVHKGDASMQLGTNGKTPVVHNLVYPILRSLYKLTAQQHGVPSEATNSKASKEYCGLTK